MVKVQSIETDAQKAERKQFNKLYKFLTDGGLDGVEIMSYEDTIRWGKGVNNLNGFKLKLLKKGKVLELELRADTGWSIVK